MKIYNKILNLTSTVSSADPNFSKLTKGYRDTNVVLWRIFSTVEGYLQYYGGITSVHAGDNISTVGDNISTVVDIQYCGGIPSVLWGITAVYLGG